MRVVLKLKTENNYLPINYNYPLSAAIYKLLQFGSPEFAEYLHSIGYNSSNKTYKLFTFSLKFRYDKIEKESFRLSDKEVLLYVSSPLIDNFVKNIVIGTFKRGKIEIIHKHIHTYFEIEQMEERKEPTLSSFQNFMLLSPMVLSTHIERNGKRVQHYFEYYENINDINRVFNQNLMNKYEAIYGNKYLGEPLKFAWLDSYIQKQLKLNRSLKRLIKINKPDTPTINVIANNIPFSLEGNPELMKVGLQAGFGEKNSMGFGMAQVLK